MSATYSYTKAAPVDLEALQAEIIADGITVLCESATYEVDTSDLDITFVTALSGPDETQLGTTVAAHTGAPLTPSLSSVTGSQDLTAGTPVNRNIPLATDAGRIKRARFWISANGADVGANVATRIQLKFFNTDGFTHDELNTVGSAGLLEDYDEFQFASQDIKVAPNNGAGSVDVDDITEFGADDLVRIHDGSAYEFLRLDGVTGPDTLDFYGTIQAAGSPAWALDDDVTRVFEIRDLGCRDEDDTDEIHLQMIPRAGDNNCRLHYWIEYQEAV